MENEKKTRDAKFKDVNEKVIPISKTFEIQLHNSKAPEIEVKGFMSKIEEFSKTQMQWKSQVGTGKMSEDLTKRVDRLGDLVVQLRKIVEDQGEELTTLVKTSTKQL